jgi:hypothetical protein
MRLSWIGTMGAAAVALPALAAPGASSSGTAPTGSIDPATVAHAQAAGSPPAARSSQGATAVQYYVDLNSASRKELMTLPGIGAAEAARIVANRPYLTKTELVTKNVMPLGPYLSLKNLVVAMPRAAPKGH